MRYNVYLDGVIINTIEATEEFVSAYSTENGYTFELIGDTPAPKPTSEPTPEEDLMAMIIDQEYRLTLLEMGV